MNYFSSLPLAVCHVYGLYNLCSGQPDKGIGQIQFVKDPYHTFRKIAEPVQVGF